MVVAVRCRAAGNGNQVGCLWIAQGLTATLLAFVLQDRFQAASQIAFADIGDGAQTTLEGSGDRRIGPGFVQFEQDMGTGERAGIGSSAMEYDMQMGALGVAQGNRLWHVQASLFAGEHTTFQTTPRILYVSGHPQWPMQAPPGTHLFRASLL